MNYEQFLRRNLRVDEKRADELACFCPFHDDKSRPSFSVNVNTGAWKCFSPKCKAHKGGKLQRLCTALKVPMPAKTAEEGAFEQVDPHNRFVPVEQIRMAMKRLWGKTGKDARDYLAKRGISSKTVKAFELGQGDDGRVWIPVKNAKGEYINVRRYDWLHVTKEKFLHFGTGFGENTFWPGGVVERHEEVILFEGETDCLLAHSLGIENAVTTTGGAGAWDDRFTRALTGKTVFVCYDIDEPGQLGALRVLRSLALSVKNAHLVRLPISEPENGDFSDYMAAIEFDRAKFLDLVGSCRESAGIVEKSLFTQLPRTAAINKRLALRAVVSGKDLTPFNIPSEVRVTCIPENGSRACQACPLKAYRGNALVPIPVTAKVVLKAVMTGDTALEVAIDKHLELPGKCPGHKTEIEKNAPLWDVRLSPDVDSGEEEGEAGARRAFSMRELNTNQPYDLEVLAASDPKTQYALLHILDAKSSQTSLDTWTPEGKEKLLKIWEPVNA